jgi:hypothetical protein
VMSNFAFETTRFSAARFIAALNADVGRQRCSVYLVFFAALRLASMSCDARAEDWNVVRTQGMVKLVVISKARERDYSLYKDAVRKLCPTDRHCGVQFWSDRRYVPSGSPLDMTDAQLNARLAAYIQNPRTGYRELVYDCRIKSDPKYCSKRSR